MLLFKCFDIWLRIYSFIKHIVFISPDNLIISNLEFPMLLQEPSGLQYFWKHIIWKSSFKMLIFFKNAKSTSNMGFYRTPGVVKGKTFTSTNGLTTVWGRKWQVAFTKTEAVLVGMDQCPKKVALAERSSLNESLPHQPATRSPELLGRDGWGLRILPKSRVTALLLCHLWLSLVKLWGNSYKKEDW